MPMDVNSMNEDLRTERRILLRCQFAQHHERNGHSQVIQEFGVSVLIASAVHNDAKVDLDLDIVLQLLRWSRVHGRLRLMDLTNKRCRSKKKTSIHSSSLMPLALAKPRLQPARASRSQLTLARTRRPHESEMQRNTTENEQACRLFVCCESQLPMARGLRKDSS
jgi:hypothetical protein